jgi:chaperone required for assembly of F1-ATPase
MTDAGIKRFYRQVTTEARPEGHVLLLDGRNARTPGRQVLAARGRALADALVAEWDAQTDTIDMSSMPLTRLQGFALDGGEAAWAEWRDKICAYAGSDLLCYRAERGELARRQEAAWTPVLEAHERRFGVPFAVTSGIIPVRQTGELEAAIAAWVDDQPSEIVLAAKLLTEITGSAALAIAIVEGDLAAADAFAASRLDEDYQAEIWGEDAEAAARAEGLRRDFDAVVRYLELVRQS